MAFNETRNSPDRISREERGMDAFGIFEGGGVKGLAHVGALRAAEMRWVKFIGVAGTSAGAIIAALIAAGYRADELYNPDAKPKGELDMDYLDILGKEDWTNWKEVISDFDRTFTQSSALKAWFSLPFFYRRNRNLLRNGIREHGIFRTDGFVTWLESLLSAKMNHSEEVLFQDLDVPLKVIASDLTNQRIKVFSQQKTPKVRVAEAVSASISIPFFFVPKQLGSVRLVDGGLLSNFPAWLFDEERRQAGPLIPTFGFQLVDPKPTTRAPGSFPAFVRNLFSTTLAGDRQLEIRGIENLHIIPLRVNVRTLDFDMQPGARDALYKDGKQGALDFFLEEIGPKDPKKMSGTLKIMHGHMLNTLNMGTIHMRVNVVMPTTTGRLRVMYTYNMGDDPDDRLELDWEGGASGRCLQKHQPVICDLVDAKKSYQDKWKMNKYQQALVRKSLKSLLSVPIFDYTKYDRSKSEKQNPVVGVLNFDSDKDLLRDFARDQVLQTAAECARLAARSLIE